MDSCTTLVKYVLFIFNTAVTVLGTLALVSGVIMLNSMGAIYVDNHKGFPPQAVPILLILFGSIVVFIAFLGCCGAIREDVCMTMCYAVVMFVLLIVQLVVVVFLWLNKEELKAGMGNLVDEAWSKHGGEAGVFEAMQESFKCCGSNGPTDYGLKFKLPPPSCCAPDTVCAPFNYYGGCKEKIVGFVSGSTDSAKHFGLGLIAVELVAFIFACCLANNVRNYKRRNAY